MSHAFRNRRKAWKPIPSRQFPWLVGRASAHAAQDCYRHVRFDSLAFYAFPIPGGTLTLIENSDLRSLVGSERYRLAYINRRNAGLTIIEQRNVPEHGRADDDRRGSGAVVSGGRYRRTRARCRVHHHHSLVRPRRGSSDRWRRGLVPVPSWEDDGLVGDSWPFRPNRLPLRTRCVCSLPGVERGQQKRDAASDRIRGAVCRPRFGSYLVALRLNAHTLQ